MKNALEGAKLECGAGEVSTEQKVKGVSGELGLTVPGEKHCCF